MKKVFFFLLLSVFYLQSCKGESNNRWKIEEDLPTSKVAIYDISKEFYNKDLDILEFKKKYPWFQGSVTDNDFLKRRNSKAEQDIYLEGARKINLDSLGNQLGTLFARVKYFFPDFQKPTVFTFSSSTQMASEPVIYDRKSNFMFIDVSGFLGENNSSYEGIEKYLKSSMNAQNLLPKIAESIAFNLVPYNKDHQKFLDQMVYSGKILTLLDAFLPEANDFDKIHYTKNQYDWATENEANTWNYFIESDLLFSADPRLEERFIAPAPFSKFYTEIDSESSPQIGVFIGWQICRKFLAKKTDVTLDDFLKMQATEIFNESGYKPK